MKMDLTKTTLSVNNCFKICYSFVIYLFFERNQTKASNKDALRLIIGGMASQIF